MAFLVAGWMCIVLSLSFHLVESDEYEEFANTLKRAREADNGKEYNITHDDLKYDKDLERTAQYNVDPITFKKDSNWEKKVTSMASDGFTIFKGKIQKRLNKYAGDEKSFIANFDVKLIEPSTKYSLYDVLYDAVAITFYYDESPDYTRFLIIFKVLTIQQYVVQHINKLRVHSSGKASGTSHFFRNKNLHEFAEDANPPISEYLKMVEAKIEKHDGYPEAYRIMKTLDKLVLTEEGYPLLKEKAWQMGVYIRKEDPGTVVIVFELIDVERLTNKLWKAFLEKMQKHLKPDTLRQNAELNDKAKRNADEYDSQYGHGAKTIPARFFHRLRFFSHQIFGKKDYTLGDFHYDFLSQLMNEIFESSKDNEVFKQNTIRAGIAIAFAFGNQAWTLCVLLEN